MMILYGAAVLYFCFSFHLNYGIGKKLNWKISWLRNAINIFFLIGNFFFWPLAFLNKKLRQSSFSAFKKGFKKDCSKSVFWRLILGFQPPAEYRKNKKMIKFFSLRPYGKTS